jgi:hypothetical protein
MRILWKRPRPRLGCGAKKIKYQVASDVCDILTCLNTVTNKIDYQRDIVDEIPRIQ